MNNNIDKSVYAPTQAEAKRKLKALIKEIENPSEPADDDEYVKPNSTRLDDWLDTWMKEYKKNSVRATTYTSYHHCIEQHIKPALGSIELER